MLHADCVKQGALLQWSWHPPAGDDIIKKFEKTFKDTDVIWSEVEPNFYKQ